MCLVLTDDTRLARPEQLEEAASVAHVPTTLAAPAPDLRHCGPWRR